MVAVLWSLSQATDATFTFVLSATEEVRQLALQIMTENYGMTYEEDAAPYPMMSHYVRATVKIFYSRLNLTFLDRVEVDHSSLLLLRVFRWRLHNRDPLPIEDHGLHQPARELVP